MDYRLVSFAPQFLQKPAHLPLGDAELLASLLLRDQFLLGFLQGHQPVSLGFGSSAVVLCPPFRLDPVNRTFLLCPNRTLLLCCDTGTPGILGKDQATTRCTFDA